ncbi:MAG: hypothetical protein A2231_00605 [Candidatus Firestonebacteria bacterium RIFOXYA2_FULL_40_8]|nr:MAG: hypothetical protein A2231_00605 [Candidatus Firestonebacteria bacterium RIFOXYA2_FULL_40_8]
MKAKLFNIILFLLFPVFLLALPGKEVTAEVKAPAATSTTPKTVVNQDGSTVITNPDGTTVVIPPVLPCEIKSVSTVKLYPGKCYPDFKINGDKFIKSALARFNSDSIGVDNILEVTPSAIKLSITVKDTAKPGKYDLIVQNRPEDICTSKNAVHVMSKPVLSVVLQKEIKQGSSGNEITVSGAGFMDGAKLEFPDASGEIVARSVSFKSDKELKASIDVAFTVKPKETGIRVVNPDGESASNKIMITTALGVSGVTPQVLPQGADNVEISVKGSNFVKGLKAEIKDEGFVANNIFVLSESEAVLSVSVAETASVGKKEITLTAPDGGLQKFNITVSLRPLVFSIMPNEMPQGTENKIVTITGNNFGKDTQIKISSPGIRINNFEIKSAQQVVAVLTVSERAPGGVYDILAVNPDGGTGVLKKSFTVNLKPELKIISPAGAVQGVFEQEVELKGQGFTRETSVKLSGEGIVISAVEYIDSTKLTALVTVGAKAPMEKRDVYVFNPDGGNFMLNDAFGISKVDKESIYYGDINKFKKPAMVNKKKLFLEHPYYKTIVRENISSEVAKYWLIVNKINESVKDAYKKIQKRYDYDLIGEVGFVTDKEGNPVKDIPDITDAVIHELER